MYVAQLSTVPEEFDVAERKAVIKLFPGPTAWITSAAMKDLKHVFTAELFDVAQASIAAQARVARFEDRRHGGLQVGRRAAALRALSDSPAHSLRGARLREWVASCSLVVLDEAQRKIRDLEQSTLRTPAEGMTPEAFRRGWQARAYRALRQAGSSGALHMHARRKLDRWHIDVLPGRRVDRWIAGITAVKDLVPPRVLAAGIRAAFNGWPTSRRFQSAGCCVLNCGTGADSIEHYAYCRVYHDLAARLLDLPRPVPSQELASFFGMAREAPSHAARRALSCGMLYTGP